MPEIIHKSTVNKNLEVTGVTLELPHLDKLWMDFQIDAGITQSGGLLSAWQSNTLFDGSAKQVTLAPANASYKPAIDSTVKLNGLSTVKFMGSGASAPFNYSPLYSSTLLTPTLASGSRKIVIAMLVRHLTHLTDSAYAPNVNLYGGALNNPNLMMNYPEGSSTKSYTSIYLESYNNSVNLSANPISSMVNRWHAVIISVDYDNVTYPRISIYVDGTLMGTKQASSISWYAAPSKFVLGGWRNTDIQQGMEANLAACLVWAEASWASGDYEDATYYLKKKYGLE